MFSVIFVEFVRASIIIIILFRPGLILVLHWAFGGLQTKPSFASPLLVVVTAAVRHRRFLGWLPVAVAATIVATVSATPVTLVASLVLGRLRYGLLSASLLTKYRVRLSARYVH